MMATKTAQSCTGSHNCVMFHSLEESMSNSVLLDGTVFTIKVEFPGTLPGKKKCCRALLTGAVPQQALRFQGLITA